MISYSGMEVSFVLLWIAIVLTVISKSNDGDRPVVAILMFVIPWLRPELFALGGLVAGLLMAVVSVSGLLSALAGEQNGAELFVLGWLGPLAVISALLIWLAVSLVFRAVQGFEVECDGTVVSVVRFSPHGSRELMRCPITECELVSGGTDLAFRFARPGSDKKEVLDTHCRLSPEEHLAIERLFLIREPSGNA